jgi:hypothetical protein
MLIEPKYCIRRAESFELLHDEIDQMSGIFGFWGISGAVPLPAPLKLKAEIFP